MIEPVAYGRSPRSNAATTRPTSSGWPQRRSGTRPSAIPSDNPFMSTEGARKEVWAYGFRNPHRLHFAIDPADARYNRLVADSVGLHTWETVNIVHKGANYGYSAREGNSTLKADNQPARCRRRNRPLS